ncbi:MAG: threonine dehydratase [Proteobacteria bacterium]|nr:threonine dehydratase [Pseudomonadota bacterium]MDA1022319.1 threonine dehydratase [Pseudomonadota bacterium]
MLPSKDHLEAAARIVAAHMAPTPQINWPLLSARAGCEVWVKHENHTPIGAFKVRGGLNFMARLKTDQPDCPGVITATRGNHGQSVALAAAKVGLSATVLAPKGNNPEKNAAMRALGADLIEHGDDFQESYEQAMHLAEVNRLYPIPPYHPWLVEGVGTYALEFMSAIEGLDTVYVPIGMGSGISGLMAARDALGLTTKVVGVVAENAPAYALSFDAGQPVATNSADTIADGMACRTPDPVAVEAVNKGAERIVRISEDEILAAMGYYFTDTHNVAEGAGAAPLAALLQERDKMAGKKVGLILSGGNADRELFKKALEAV